MTRELDPLTNINDRHEVARQIMAEVDRVGPYATREAWTAAVDMACRQSPHGYEAAMVAVTSCLK